MNIVLFKQGWRTKHNFIWACRSLRRKLFWTFYLWYRFNFSVYIHAYPMTMGNCKLRHSHTPNIHRCVSSTTASDKGTDELSSSHRDDLWLKQWKIFIFQKMKEKDQPHTNLFSSISKTLPRIKCDIVIHAVAFFPFQT